MSEHCAGRRIRVESESCTTGYNERISRLSATLRKAMPACAEAGACGAMPGHLGALLVRQCTVPPGSAGASLVTIDTNRGPKIQELPYDS